MNLHEYQAKQILKEYNLPVPNGYLITNADSAVGELSKLQTMKIVLKAQVHAGGRGKSGGVRIEAKDDVVKVARSMLHKNLITYQTNIHGQPVNSLLLEETCDIARELYLGAVVDRSQRRVVIMASTEGGVEIEKVADQTPEKIIKFAIDPLLGIMLYQCRELAYALKLTLAEMKQFNTIVMQIGKLFMQKDLNILEINPLVITKDGQMLCLDAKMVVDENALYRQPAISAMWDPTQEDDREIKAKEWETEKASKENALKATSDKASALEGELAKANAKIAEVTATIESMQKDMQAKRREDDFQNRMTSIASEFELSDKESELVAKQIKNLDEVAYASWFENFSVFAASKNKKAIASLKEEEAKKIEEIKKATLEEISKASKSEEQKKLEIAKASEEEKKVAEVAVAALEKTTEAPNQGIANTTSTTTVSDPQKEWKDAFGGDNLNISL